MDQPERCRECGDQLDPDQEYPTKDAVTVCNRCKMGMA